MRTVRAAVFPAPSAPVELREYPEPDLEPGSGLLAVDYSEVCGTDVHLQEGRLAGVPYPLIPGHVAVGRLEAARGTVRDVHGRPVREGDSLTFLDVHRTCHACWHCLVAKASTRCPDRKVYGITYGADDGLSGGWSEKLYLKPGTRLLPLAREDFEGFMAGGCGMPTAVHGVERAEVQLGESVLVLGVGPVGLSAVALARLRGAATVLAIGAPSERLSTAKAMGADDVLDFTNLDEGARIAWVRENTEGRGADVVIEATGAPEAVTQSMRYARDAGRVVVVGQYTDRGESSFNPHLDLNQKHLDVRGCWGSDFSHFHRAVQIASHPDLGAAWRKIPLTSYSLEQAGDALAAVAAGEAVKALIRPGD